MNNAINNTIHIEAALDRFSDTFDTFKTPPISQRTTRDFNSKDFNNGTEYRIMQLRWMEFGLSLMLDQARSTLRLVNLYEKEDADDT